ncbi:photosynthetic complex assembly protein PuhC [Aurantiacibacter zhengii]|uniref:Phosphonoacetaldehyde methylase n=1 Tax=Aurantiacibacter zhengii TaxID=2307003 RepID=A0A418NRC2_9SPHN|nr:photosynthetic complex assembly protein PuhC [Aurantiacibacter zhengii]RIV85616.1 phosphonoacetaldehyde methylase [Aurantiacibacter zhengii]
MTHAAHHQGHGHSHENTVPRPALFLVGGLVFASLTMTALVTTGWLEREAVPTAVRAEANVAPVTTRHLTFADLADGGVRIAEAGSDNEVALITSDTTGSGFIRGVLRGLARERRMQGIGAAPPFALTLWEDGSLSLTDEATGRIIELGGFGPDNRAAFIALLPEGTAS